MYKYQHFRLTEPIFLGKLKRWVPQSSPTLPDNMHRINTIGNQMKVKISENQIGPQRL
jgi:hypothetical protein